LHPQPPRVILGEDANCPATMILHGLRQAKPFLDVLEAVA
jgi:hypothetical protein